MLNNLGIFGLCDLCLPLVAKAPAVQLQEHAKAILEDDRAQGFERSDPFVRRLARGDASHAVPWI